MIKIWNIDTFHFVVYFKLSTLFSDMIIFNSDYFCGHYDNNCLSIGKINNYAKFLYSHNSDVIIIDKAYSSCISNLKARNNN